MSLESGTYINSLVATNPPGTDDRATADDHLRLVKSTILNTFPNLTGAMNASHTELNYMVGVTSLVQTQITKVDFIDVCGAVANKPANSLIILNFITARGYTLPEDLTGSYVEAQVAATANTTLTLKKNGSSIGTVSIAAAATTGTFTFAADISFVAGDILTLHNQAAADATLSDIAFNFKGTLT